MRPVGTCFGYVLSEQGKDVKEVAAFTVSCDNVMAQARGLSIPASSSPWDSSIGNTVARVHYANNTTNGAYYTWCAATAGTCLQGTDEEVKDKDAPASICPRGWRLPSLSEYQNFLTKAGINYRHYNGSSWSGSSSASDSTKIRGTPYNFPYAGIVYNGSLNEVGSNGRYWSSTAYNSDSAYYLYFSSSYVNTSWYSRYGGLSVRCIAL